MTVPDTVGYKSKGPYHADEDNRAASPHPGNRTTPRSDDVTELTNNTTSSAVHGSNAGTDRTQPQHADDRLTSIHISVQQIRHDNCNLRLGMNRMRTDLDTQIHAIQQVAAKVDHIENNVEHVEDGTSIHCGFRGYDEVRHMSTAYSLRTNMTTITTPATLYTERVDMVIGWVHRICPP